MLDSLFDTIVHNFDTLQQLGGLAVSGQVLESRSEQQSDDGGGPNVLESREDQQEDGGGPNVLESREDQQEDAGQQEDTTPQDVDTDIDTGSEETSDDTAEFDEVFGNVEQFISDENAQNLQDVFADQPATFQEDLSENVESIENTSITDEDRQNVRNVAQEFLPEDNETRQQIESQFPATSVEEMEEDGGTIDGGAEEVSQNAGEEPVDSDALSSQFSGDDLFSQVDNYVDTLSSLQDELAEATEPDPQIQQTQEELNTLRQSFREETGRVRRRSAPEFAIKGELARANREFSRQKQGLVDELEAQRQTRSQEIDSITQRMDATQQNLQLLQGLSDLTTPNTRQFKEKDGKLFAIQENPVTGEINPVEVMETSENFTPKGVFQDSTGNYKAYGLDDDGGSYITRDVSDEIGKAVAGDEEESQDLNFREVDGQVVGLDPQTGEVVSRVGSGDGGGGGDDTSSGLLIENTENGQTADIGTVAGIETAVNDFGENPADVAATLSNNGYDQGTIERLFAGASVALPTTDNDEDNGALFDTSTSTPASSGVSMASTTNEIIPGQQEEDEGGFFSNIF